MKQFRSSTNTTASFSSILPVAGLVLTLSTVTAQQTACTAEQMLPDSLTNSLGLGAIPQTCIPAPAAAASNVPRCYHTYVPPCAAASESPVPLVMDIHGLASCPLASAYYTGWAQKATQECMVVVYPLGTIDTNVTAVPCFAVAGGTPSADGTAVSSDCCCYSLSDGFEFVKPDVTHDMTVLRNMVLDVVATAPVVHNVTIDATRIYMAGHSNGCMASMAMAVMHSDMVAAVCCHAGAVVTPVTASDNYSPVPIWRVHGVLDKTIPYAGGLVVGQRVLSAQHGFNYMGDANGCDDAIVTTNITGGTRMQRVNCTNGATVELMSLDASGHSPYAGSMEFDDGVADTVIDTTTPAWEFCSSFRKPEVPQAFTNVPTMAPTTVNPTDSPTVSSSAASTRRGGYDTAFQALATLVSAGLFVTVTCPF